MRQWTEIRHNDLFFLRPLQLITHSNTIMKQQPIQLKKRHQIAHQSIEPTQTVSLTYYHFDSHVGCNGMQILGVFARLRKVTTSVVTSVRPPAWNNLAPTRRGFMIFDIWGFFSYVCRENSSLIEIRQAHLVLYMKTYTHLWHSSQNENCPSKKVVEKIKTQILCSCNFFPKIVPFMRYCGKIP